MANGCINGELDEAKYASLVPVIGLYIAAGSSVCLLFMLYDIIIASRYKKGWIPCRLFSLNSVTLTLLSICAKLPVDLTTPMPSAKDQLSKLTGTTLICISMGFLNPSVGDNRKSECLTNMVALSILVITIMVNICMQISTGVIYLFVNEHIIIMCIMVVLLWAQWYSAMNINSLKELSLDFNKNLFTKGELSLGKKIRPIKYTSKQSLYRQLYTKPSVDPDEKLITKVEGSMLQRLKVSYLYGFDSNPQFSICRHDYYSIVAGCCLTSIVVLIQATHRSLILRKTKVCGGVSDYDRSIWLIVMIQIITNISGCLAVCFRWFTLAFVLKSADTSSVDIQANTLIRNNPIILGGRLWVVCGFYLKLVVDVVLSVFCVAFLFMLSPFLFARRCCLHKYDNREQMQEFTHLIGIREKQLDGWTVWKALKDIDRLVEVGKSKPPISLSQVLSRKSPSRQLHSMQLKDLVYPDKAGIEVSSLAMALLVKIATFSIPNKLTKPLEQTFREAYTIIDFIETRTNSRSLKNRTKSKLAKAVLIGNSFEPLRGIIKKYGTLSEFNRARAIITELKNTKRTDFVWKEVGAITDLIHRRRYKTVEDLYNHMEQIFVDMLHIFLAELPNAIFKEITESPAEEFEQRVRFALKLLSKIESLESQVQWSFPTGCNISSLITPLVPATQSQSHTLTVNNVGGSMPLQVTSDGHPNISSCHPSLHGDVIVQVE